jgi:hypothetical protein
MASVRLLAASSSALSPRCRPEESPVPSGLPESTRFVAPASEPPESRELVSPVSTSPVSALVDPSAAPEEESDEPEGPDESDEPEEPDESEDPDEPEDPEELEEPEESEEPEEPGELDEPDESSATPVFTSGEPESVPSPWRSPQVGQAPTPWSARTFSATAICWDRLAWSALGAYARPPYFSQSSCDNCSPP